MKTLTVILITLTLSSCTWVKVTEEGQAVSILDTNALSSCKVVGKVTAISRAKVAGISRSEKKLVKELESIARNEAATMGGNAVAPLTEIEGNEREFRVYQCD